MIPLNFNLQVTIPVTDCMVIATPLIDYRPCLGTLMTVSKKHMPI